MRRFREISSSLARSGHTQPSNPRFCAAALAAALALAALLGACHRGRFQERPRVVVDYRNGWYHKASGAETIAAIAGRYRRDPALVAEINRNGGPYAIPEPGKMFYIPPGNDRNQVREVLTRLQGHPELIPKTPWDPAMAVLAGPVKTAEPVKVRLGDTRPLEPGEAVQLRVIPANSVPAGKRRVQEEYEPPPPGRKEIVIAEPRAPDKSKDSIWNWLVLGRTAKPTPRPAAPAPTPKPQSNVASSGFVWPVKGQIVTPYKGGWHNACHGIEIAAAEGTPVHAARDGMVLLAQAYPGYGNLVLIDHGDGFATAYGYNRQMLVREGERVERGQTIASVGRPTQGSTSKLLFQVRRNALPVDPMQFLKDS